MSAPRCRAAHPLSGEGGAAERIVDGGPAEDTVDCALTIAMPSRLRGAGRYADAGLTELFLEPNFQPGGAALDRTLGHMEALAP